MLLSILLEIRGTADSSQKNGRGHDARASEMASDRNTGTKIAGRTIAPGILTALVMHTTLLVLFFAEGD